MAGIPSAFHSHTKHDASSFPPMTLADGGVQFHVDKGYESGLHA